MTWAYVLLGMGGAGLETETAGGVGFSGLAGMEAAGGGISAAGGEGGMPPLGGEGGAG